MYTKVLLTTDEVIQLTMLSMQLEIGSEQIDNLLKQNAGDNFLNDNVYLISEELFNTFIDIIKYSRDAIKQIELGEKGYLFSKEDEIKKHKTNARYFLNLIKKMDGFC